MLALELLHHLMDVYFGELRLLELLVHESSLES